MSESTTIPIISNEPAAPTDYSYWGAGSNEPPAHLLTKNQLREKGLKLAPSQLPAGRIWLKKRKLYILLYDETAAALIPTPTEAQLARREKAKQTQRTCKGCGRVSKYTLFRQPGHLCWDCQDKKRLASVAKEAAELLADPDKVCILDTETTGLYSPFIIQVAVIDGLGKVLLDTKVKLAPGQEIEESATYIHSITEADLADAPDWREVWPKLQEACRGRTIVTYNLEFDRNALRYTRLTCGTELVGLGRAGYCAMELYAAYVVEPYETDSYGVVESYRYQKLPGGDHTALGDCRATLALLRMMADVTTQPKRETEVVVEEK